ncbi:MAG TPA: non-canonical purine NTP pyrophosphatase [Gaiellaceae bacterium]|nr:non-canonical purine NTP pyrophosphatase [Gaiellaceae bacterium]
MRARVCSQNPHKLDELRASLPGWELELLEADEYPPEDGTTYEENARGKARYGRAHAPADEWVLGEDSGIEVAALGGAPGIYSARYGGDGSGKERVLRELEGVDDRRARYVCAVVAIAPDGRELVVTETLDGTVAHELRGSQGFGYDPLFVPAGEARTVAELGDAWKAHHSHRARAAARLAELTRGL